MSKLNEYSKMALNLLNEIWTTLSEDKDVLDIPDIDKRIGEVVRALYTETSANDDVVKRENNPEQYTRMCVARSRKDCDAALDAFFEELMAARLRNQIADVHVLIKTTIEKDGVEFPSMSYMHLGAVQEAEGMCAWGLGKATERRRNFTEHMMKQGSDS